MRLLTPILALALVLSLMPARSAHVAPAGLQPIPDTPLLPDYVFEERLADGRTAESGFVELRGQVLVVVFWATWCGVCAGEIPKLDRLQAQLGGKGLQVVALSQDRAGTALVQSYFARRGVQHLRVFHDTQSATATHLGVVGVPSAIVADRNGRVRFAGRGALPWGSTETRALLERLLGEGAATES